MNNHFLGKTLAVINDLSIPERKYLFQKTRELKEAISSGDTERIDSFRIADDNLGIYEVFLEDSTRTKESFNNAAKFHKAKLSSLNTDSSSFNKGESYADTFNTLIGYDNSIFIIRSKLEGVCRWLEEASGNYARRNGKKHTPSFINAGDGKHEHPTQELLDCFTFLEDNDWNYDAIHIALVGDLFHGRTVHSKVDGLQVFNSVTVDLIAPEELAMPESYVSRMKEHGYTVRLFASIEEYLNQDLLADKWYFTRPQLERMGDRILQKQEELRRSITFRASFMPKLKEGTTFYHPLPRHRAHPVIPFFLDETPLNGWERQSSNGMLVRIILLGLFSGKLGGDYVPEPVQAIVENEEDYIEAVALNPGKVVEAEAKKHYSEGVHPISDGLVIDHICKGDTPEEIRRHMSLINSVLSLHGKGGEWVSTSKKAPEQFKGIIFRPNQECPDRKEMKRLAAVAPGATLNIIKQGRIEEKYRLHMPPRIYNFDDLSCRNEACISHPEHHEAVPARFTRTADDRFECVYCGKIHTFKEIWK